MCRKFSRTVITAIAVLQLSIPMCHASRAKNESPMPITVAELNEAMGKLPVTSEMNISLIARANGSGLSEAAYDLYKAAWSKDPNNGFRALWCGMAAEHYEQFVFRVRTPGQGVNVDHEKGNKAFSDAQHQLAQAAKLLPNSPTANAQYGHLLWQALNDEPRGIALVRKASALAPRDARVHAMLGDMYSSPNSKVFDETRAIAELKKASEIDPLYAYPHWRLMGLYGDMKRKKEARQEALTCFNLTLRTDKSVAHLKADYAFIEKQALQ